MKTKYILLINLFLCLSLVGCKESWDEYYKKTDDQGGENITANLWNYIKSRAEYSKFVQLLEETGMAQELDKDQPLTVWIPTNDVLEDVSQLNATDKKTFVLNHLNYLALYETKLKDDKIVKTIAGKNLILKEIAANSFTIDGRQITKLNQICTNGVLHEINGSLQPRKNIYEYIVESGPEYSTYRDSLLSRNDTIFVPGNSFPIGIDELGNTVYDSVFVIQNPFLSAGDIRSEDTDFTFLMPTNQAISDMWDQMHAIFTSAGKELSKDDSVTFFRWIMRATTIKEKIESFETAGSVRSVYNYELKTNYQLVDPNYKICSNGLIYPFTSIHIPKFLYLPQVDVELFELTDPKHKLKRGDIFTDPDAMWNIEPASAGYQTYSDAGGTKYLYIEDSPRSKHPVLTFKTVTKNRLNQLIEAKIMPGKYKIMGRFRTYNCGTIYLDFNSTRIMAYNTLSGTTLVDNVMLASFEIPESWGFNSIKVRIEDWNAPSWRIMIGAMKFIPLEDNY